MGVAGRLTVAPVGIAAISDSHPVPRRTSSSEVKLGPLPVSSTHLFLVAPGVVFLGSRFVAGAGRLPCESPALVP